MPRITEHLCNSDLGVSDILVAFLKYFASLNVVHYTSYFLLKSHRRLSRSFVKCNQVCELSSSESLAGNGQDLAPALCASHQRMAIALAILEVKEAAFAMGG